MITLGITGSIGMGKTTAAKMLRDMGVPVHDSDASVHALLGPGGAAVAAVAMRFPEARREDAAGRAFIDRQALGRVVFGDAAQKKALEEILHPLVRADSDRFKEDMRAQGHAFAALDIPLLFETGGEGRVDKIICVTAPPEVQRARVLARPGMTEEKFARILAGQMPDAEKRARADFVVGTDKGIEDTRRQLGDILRRLKEKGT